MGKLEKLVVLTVLFLVAVILGVSLNSDKGVTVAKEGPLSIARGPDAEPAAEAREDPASAAGAKSQEAGARPIGPRGTLSATFPSETEAPAEPGQAAETPAHRPLTGQASSEELETPPAAEPEPAAEAEPEAYVVTTLGLQPSLSEDVMLYTWKRGDSFAQLAATYYGSSSKVYRLERANEGRAEASLRAGQQILVPVLPDSTPEPVAEEGKTAWAGGSTYTVGAGDVLGTISQTVYGTSQSWRKIYDANRDQLADPNHLRVGMVLRIPE